VLQRKFAEEITVEKYTFGRSIVIIAKIGHNPSINIYKNEERE
jgi:hypothetical protein